MSHTTEKQHHHHPFPLAQFYSYYSIPNRQLQRRRTALSERNANRYPKHYQRIINTNDYAMRYRHDGDDCPKHYECIKHSNNRLKLQSCTSKLHRVFNKPNNGIKHTCDCYRADRDNRSKLHHCCEHPDRINHRGGCHVDANSCT